MVLVKIVPDIKLPEVNEPIKSFERTPGNIFTAPREANFAGDLDTYSPTVAILILRDIIRELDYGNKGVFNDEWCNKVASQVREIRIDKDVTITVVSPQWQKFFEECKSPDVFWAHIFRTRLREDAIRFFLYYSAGYQVVFSNGQASQALSDSIKGSTDLI